MENYICIYSLFFLLIIMLMLIYKRGFIQNPFGLYKTHWVLYIFIYNKNLHKKVFFTLAK